MSEAVETARHHLNTMDAFALTKNEHLQSAEAWLKLALVEHLIDSHLDEAVKVCVSDLIGTNEHSL